MVAVVQVNDFFCSSRVDDLEWFASELKGKYEIKANFSDRNCLLRVIEEGAVLQGVRKGFEVLLKECTIEGASGAGTPSTRELAAAAGEGDPPGNL